MKFGKTDPNYGIYKIYNDLHLTPKCIVGIINYVNGIYRNTLLKGSFYYYEQTK